MCYILSFNAVAGQIKFFGGTQLGRSIARQSAQSNGSDPKRERNLMGFMKLSWKIFEISIPEN